MRRYQGGCNVQSSYGLLYERTHSGSVSSLMSRINSGDLGRYSLKI
jgi:hypothetical protein